MSGPPALSASSRSAGEPEENENCPVHCGDVLVPEPSDKSAKPASRHRRNLVDHEARWFMQAIGAARIDRHAKQGRFGRIGGERAYGDGSGRVEAIVLQNDRRPWLSGIATTARHRPN